MTIIKTTDGGYTTYFYDGIKRYEHYKDSNGYEWWKEYDAAGNVIHYKDSDDTEWWSEYDAVGNEIHYKNSNGYEWWRQSGCESIKEEDVRAFQFDR